MICLHYLRSYTVTDRVLCLYAEEEAWRKAVNVVNTRFPATFWLIIGQVWFLQIPVSKRNQPPDDGERKPR